MYYGALFKPFLQKGMGNRICYAAGDHKLCICSSFDTWADPGLEKTASELREKIQVDFDFRADLSASWCHHEY
jgi:hypothetical protein